MKVFKIHHQYFFLQKKQMEGPYQDQQVLCVQRASLTLLGTWFACWPKLLQNFEGSLKENILQ